MPIVGEGREELGLPTSGTVDGRVGRSVEAEDAVATHSAKVERARVGADEEVGLVEQGSKVVQRRGRWSERCYSRELLCHREDRGPIAARPEQENPRAALGTESLSQFAPTGAWPCLVPAISGRRRVEQDDRPAFGGTLRTGEWVGESGSDLSHRLTGQFPGGRIGGRPLVTERADEGHIPLDAVDAGVGSVNGLDGHPLAHEPMATFP